MSDNPQSTQDTAGVQRTPTGEIATQTQTTDPKATTPQTSTTATEKPSLANEPAGTVANQPAETQTGAPAEYSTFAVPDGYELDTNVATEAGKIFKEMNLTQDQAQKLVDFYTAKTTESANQPYQVWNEMQEKWVKEVKNDPQMGPRLNEVKTTISRAIDGLGDPKLAQEFRAAMDYTGAGNNPAFIKAFWKLSQKVTEGGHVSGSGPSPAAQPNGGRPASAAQAMYPNLPTNR
jgi:hypothetical protein